MWLGIGLMLGFGRRFKSRGCARGVMLLVGPDLRSIRFPRRRSGDRLDMAGTAASSRTVSPFFVGPKKDRVDQ